MRRWTRNGRALVYLHVGNVFPAGVLEDLRLIACGHFLIEPIFFHLLLVGLQLFRIDIARRELMLGIDLDRRGVLQTGVGHPLQRNTAQVIRVQKLNVLSMAALRHRFE